MSDNTSREAFERALPEIGKVIFLVLMDSTARRPDGLYQRTAVEAAWRGWQASRKQALVEVAALFPDISAGYRSTTIKQAIEELK